MQFNMSNQLSLPQCDDCKTVGKNTGKYNRTPGPKISHTMRATEKAGLGGSSMLTAN